MSSIADNLNFSGVQRVSVAALLRPIMSAEVEAVSDPQIAVVEEDLSFSGMTRAPQDISDVIVHRLRELSNVKAVLMGRSGEVYHVWTMIENWTAADRKVVYAVQKELLSALNGFDLDFYVVKLDANVTPEELVSDIPMVYSRTS